MIYKCIVFGGGPLVGKHSLLTALADVVGTSPPQNCNDNESKQKIRVDRLHTLKIINELYELDFYTSCGVVFYKEEVFTYILSKADIVIYVFSTDLKYDMTAEISTFETYVQIAQSMGKLWSDIPWIFVLNKIDLAAIIPPFIQLPKELLDNVIETSAYTGIGVDLLWKKILETVSMLE